MQENIILFSIFVIFAGAAVFSTIALYLRQSLLVAYMILGIVIGPFGLKWVNNPHMIEVIGSFGIVFLLFLLGLHLQPQSLLHVIKKISWLAFLSSVLFAAIGFGVGQLFGFTRVESIVIGAAMMFSSTIIGLKLLPTTVLHHQLTGELMIGILLLQDLIAIFCLIITNSANEGAFHWMNLGIVLIYLPLLVAFAFIFNKLILLRLLKKFSRIREYIFLLSIAWCLFLSELAHYLGLSREIGAFIAGVSIATSPIAVYIAESLKPVRDFFLVLFFFALGASIDLSYMLPVLLPSLVLAGILLFTKPAVFSFLLQKAGESKKTSWEVSVRLGQTSEFSLILALIALQELLISKQVYTLIELVTIFTFVVSSYYVVLRYQTPVALSDKLRRD